MTLDPKSLATTAVQTFGDEFDTFRLWDGHTGWDVTGGPQWSGRVSPAGTLPYNNELQWYVDPRYQPQSGGPVLPNPFSVAGGALDITARPADPALQPALGGQRYTSGIVTTAHEFAQTYGYFEMRAEMPAGQGVWPAFWLLPVDGSWPPELDVMELLGHQTTTLHTTVHSKVSGATQDSAVHYETSAGTTVADMTAGFHVYGVDWEADHIAWFFDGQEVFRATTPADMNKPMYMVANLAVGGDWPGSPDGSTPFPATMKIDYIRAYATKPALAAGDSLVGTDADELLTGSPGNDTLLGAGGADRIYGNLGSDIIYGNLGQDTLFGGQGADTLSGGRDADVVYGNVGDDVVYGNLGNDTLFGGAGNDLLFGGQGNDVLAAGLGNDTLVGSLGADTFVFGQGNGTDIVLGFNAAAGDRLSLGGQSYIVGAAGDGSALLALSGGGSIELADVAPGQVGDVMFM